VNHLVPCPECSRHVRVSETECPFCALPLDLSGTPEPQLPRARLGRAATFAFGATLASVAAVVACGGEATETRGGAGATSAGGANAGGGAGATSAGGTTARGGVGGTAAGAGGAFAGAGGITIAPPYGIPPPPPPGGSGGTGVGGGGTIYGGPPP